MLGNHAIYNDALIPAAKAKVRIDHIEYTYGYGVYENLRLRNGTVYFLDHHIDRLFASAQAIGITPPFDKERYKKNIHWLIKENNVETANIKIILIGGGAHHPGEYFIFLLAPKFVDKKLYKTGVHVITKQYERFLPHAKTLNMLPSYLIYKEAQAQDAYDALLVNQQQEIVEGTRTNVFVMKGNTLITPPASNVLNGVTRQTLLSFAQSAGYTIKEKPIRIKKLKTYDCAFLTSTSAKILPIRSIGDVDFGDVPETLKTLMKTYSEWVDAAHA